MGRKGHEEMSSHSSMKSGEGAGRYERKGELERGESNEKVDKTDHARFARTIG